MNLDRFPQPTDWDYTRNATPEKEFNFDDLCMSELESRNAIFATIGSRSRPYCGIGLEHSAIVKGADERD